MTEFPMPVVYDKLQVKFTPQAMCAEISVDQFLFW